MMKKIKSTMRILIMTAICSVTAVLPALAEKTPAVAVPVQISLSGTLPDPAEDFVVELKADNAANPMPENAQNGICSVTITGAGSETFPALTYDKPGIYSYTIYQAAGTNAKCTYDDTVYALTVYVTNAEDGSGLETAAVLYPDIRGSKQSGAEFENVYETEQTETGTEPETEQETNEPETQQTETDETETDQTETDEPETQQSEKSDTKTPGTGDDTNLMLYMVLAGVSMMLFVGLFLGRRRKTEE